MVPANFEQYVHFVCIHQQTSDKAVFLLFRIPETSQWGRKNKKKNPAGTDTAETLRRLSRTPSRSELECDEDFLGTTGRREVQLAHKQETAEATNTMGFPVYPPPYRIISHFTHSHLCLSSRVLLLILPSQVAPPPPPHLQHHGVLFLTLLMFLGPHPHLLPTAPIKTRSDKSVKCSF